MLELIGWEIVIFGGVIGWCVARTWRGQALVLGAVVLAGGLLLVEGQRLREGLPKPYPMSVFDRIDP